MALSRQDLINQIYYQELGRTAPDQAGLDYWMGKTDVSDDQLRDTIRASAGISGDNINQPLMADQGYAAFLRGNQLDASQIEGARAQAVAASIARGQAQSGNWETQRRDQARSINQGFESRGMQRSGSRLRGLAESESGIAGRQKSFELGLAQEQARANTGAAAAQERNRLAKTEEQLKARDRLTLRSQEMNQA